MRILRQLLALLAALNFWVSVASASDATPSGEEVIAIQYAKRRFTPAKIEVPAGKSFTLKIFNSSAERIEFESFALKREKVVSPGQTLTLHFSGLSAGHYDFFDDFHDDVPEGDLVAR